jgi:lysine-N-methylase
LGADCEDTCCVGWIVNVDKSTYDAYQRCANPEFGPRLRELVTISAAPTDESYGRITLSGDGCGFLTGGLCSIHQKLGEQYLSVMCSQYPRVMNVVDDVLQRSLDLSCPEAARIVLLDPEPMQFDEEEGPLRDPRLGHLSVLTTANSDSAKPYVFFRQIREVIIWLLQYRAYPLWKRVTILASLCDQLQQSGDAGLNAQVPEVLAGYRDAVKRNLFDQALATHSPKPVALVELAIELIVGRISSEYTAPRFLECYRQFMHGMEWTAESSMTDIGRRYAAAYTQYHEPFVDAHPMLEHYLVSYVHRTLFPLGPQESDRELSVHHIANTIRDQGLLLLTHYAIIQTILVGLAGLHKEKFGADQAIGVIQSFTKSFEHDLNFPGRALKLLADKGIQNCVNLAMLVRS